MIDSVVVIVVDLVAYAAALTAVIRCHFIPRPAIEMSCRQEAYGPSCQPNPTGRACP